MTQRKRTKKTHNWNSRSMIWPHCLLYTWKWPRTTRVRMIFLKWEKLMNHH